MAEAAPRLREHLQVVLHPWPGACQQKEQLQPLAASAVAGELPGLAICGYLGDMRLRFVFAEPGSELPSAALGSDLERLDLTPARALALATVNLKRGFGAPHASPVGGGVYSLRASQHGYGPSYMLDRGFWKAQLEKFPRGLIAAVPQRGVLMFAPAGDPIVERELDRQAAALVAGAGASRISACTYLFDATGWRVRSQLPVFKPPVKDEDDEEREHPVAEHQAELDLAMAARGQKMLVRSIIAGFVLNAVLRSADLPLVVALALSVSLSVYSLLGVARLGVGLRNRTGLTITTMVLSFFPLFNLISWIALSVQATRALREAGWRVGLFGARED